jgi:O-antigen ligase
VNQTLAENSKPSAGARGIALMPALAGISIALFLFAGRWSPVKEAQGDTDPSMLVQVRFWVLLILIGLTFLSLFDKKPDSGFKLSRPVYRICGWACAFLIFMLLSITWASNLDIALEKGADVGMMLVFTVCSFLLLARFGFQRVSSSFWATVTCLTFVLAVLGLASGSSSDRMAVLGGGPNVYGRLMGVLFIIGMYNMFKHGRAYFWLPICALAIVLIVMTGSRGALVAVTAAGLLGLVFLRIQVWRLLLVIAVLAAVVPYVLLNTNFGLSVVQRFEYRVVNLTVEQQYSSGRDVRYDDAITLGLRHPVFGAGLGGFAAEYYHAPHQYPHNLFLEAFSEGGFSGVALLSWFLLASMWYFWKARPRLDIMSLLSFILFLVASQFSGDFFDSRALFVFPLLVITQIESSGAARARTNGILDSTKEPERV